MLNLDYWKCNTNFDLRWGRPCPPRAPACSRRRLSLCIQLPSQVMAWRSHIWHENAPKDSHYIYKVTEHPSVCLSCCVEGSHALMSTLKVWQKPFFKPWLWNGSSLLAFDLLYPKLALPQILLRLPLAPHPKLANGVLIINLSFTPSWMLCFS